MRHLARAVARATAIGVLGLGLLGMGGFGGGRERLRDFRATFLDVDGTRIEVGRVTTGTDDAQGELGRGRPAFPSDNIERITFKRSPRRERLLADVKLREGDPLTLSLRGSTTFYGRIPSGAYQIAPAT
jgi:hypothetical protein